MHDKIIQILLVVQEVTKLPGHAFLDTGFLSTDEALKHHPTQPGANLKCLPTSSRKKVPCWGNMSHLQDT